MPYYKSVFAYNSVVSINEVAGRSEEEIMNNPNGSLIHTIIQAENIEEAELISRTIGVVHNMQRDDITAPN